MDIESLRLGAEVVGGGVLGTLSWFVRSLIADLKDKHVASNVRHDRHESEITKLASECAERRAAIEKDLAAHKLHVAENYSTKNDLGKAIEQFTRSTDAVFDRLGRIEDKIDKKADKVAHIA